MKVYKAPESYIIEPTRIAIFLAGSIEMGKAEDWQTKLTNSLKSEESVIILNPRRDDWDSTWKQEIGNKQFREQVEWELKALEDADIIALYFDKETESPISLLELGLHSRSKKMIVCCPDGFWRKGNVDIVCKKYDIPLFESMDELISAIRKRVKALS